MASIVTRDVRDRASGGGGLSQAASVKPYRQACCGLVQFTSIVTRDVRDRASQPKGQGGVYTEPS